VSPPVAEAVETGRVNVIIVSGNLGSGRTIALTGWQLAGSLVALVLVLALAVGTAQVALLRYGAAHNSPLVQTVLGAAGPTAGGEGQSSMLRESLDLMATKVGEMQARLLRLDVLGERLARAAGFKPQEFNFEQAPGRGGPATSSLVPRELSVGELTQRLDQLARQVDDRTERLGIIESIVTLDFARRTFVPSGTPVTDGNLSSNFGWRIDPFTGRNAFHEGVDFFADPGTPILAAASGVVVVAEFHPHYGRMVEVDHGNDLVTRYAHAQALHVKVGDIVRRGQRIADVGSSGRSTGPHLHFEVRYRGIAQNPARFLARAG